MKKLFALFIASGVSMFPLATYAAVNITLREADTGSVAIDIDTETDTLESVSLPISYPEGVEITDVTEGDVTCSELAYTESQDNQNTIVISCTLDSATALDGVLANINFTSTGDAPVIFEVVESDELDLDTLTLGQAVNLEQTSAGSTTDDVTTTGEDLLTTTETPTTNEDLMVIAEEPITTTEGNLLSSITEYLPYILIAGSVILLISIVVILLRKNKDPKEPKMKKDKKGEQEEMPPVMGGAQQSERSLKDMVNNPESAPAPDPIAMSQNTPQMPQAQPTYTPPQQGTPIISSTSQEEDLQEILQRESFVPTAMGDNFPPEETPGASLPNQEVPFSTGFSVPLQQGGPENIMPEAPQTPPTQEFSPLTSAPETEVANPTQQPGTTQDLQEDVNGYINQINGGVIHTQQPPIGTTTPQQPTQPESQPQMPPITLQQNPSIDNTPEEMPPVPPTM
jgi:hypothetical protein